MSLRSPRGSISGPSSADVAADFEDSLKDLQMNNRYEISNLTIIAKENTEHAEAISHTLESHIKNTSPSRKLPALYVLDSIVKNVGTPYTTYLGRNLFRTFMDAYVLVDATTRRNMEGMLKTWKEPVPGSIDARPVFPPENVRPIDNALIKAKTAAIQNQRQAQPSQMALRGTATPPHMNGQFMPPPHQAVQPQYPGFPPQPGSSFPYATPGPISGLEVENLRRDIAYLISRDTHVVSLNPSDLALRTRLQALSDLQNLLNIRSFNPSELQAIRAQVQQISSAESAAAALTPPQASQWSPPAPNPQAYSTPQHSFAAHPQPAPSTHTQPPTLNAETISGLQALLANVPKPSTPQIRAAVPTVRDASHAQLNALQAHAAAAPSSNGASDLLSSLSKAGLIKFGTNQPPNTSSISTIMPPHDQTAMLLQSLQGVLGKSASSATPQQILAPPSAASISKVPINAASLRVFRPDHVAAIYDAQPNQCSICGRRFTTADASREKKSRHLDWHFRTNQRMADPNLNRGHHRNWYVDELEWVKHVEFDPSTAATGTGDGDAASRGKKSVREQFVRAPPGMTKNTCNICFEDMKSSYSESQQDWIFADATVNNGKIVHAQCLAEMTKSHGIGGSLASALAPGATGARERSATPDSTLGKRKAETSMVGSGARIKLA